MKSIVQLTLLTIYTAIKTATATGSSELFWSSELCPQIGPEYNDFDYCGEIIFCEDTRTIADINKLRGSSSNLDISRLARYGWRLPGEKSCSWPGPLIRIKPGTKYGLFVKGSGDASTSVNIHLHGLHISGMGNGDDVRRSVSGSDVIFYNVTMPEDHMGGTYFYHSHYHGMSYSHVKNGAFGMLIVEDADVAVISEEEGGLDEGVRKFLQNEQLLILANMPGIPGRFKSAQTMYHINSNEWYRFRVLTMSIDSHQAQHRLLFDLPAANSISSNAALGSKPELPCETRMIAHDGILRFEVPSEIDEDASYDLNGASRIDLAVRCRAGADIMIGGMPVAAIKVTTENIDTNPVGLEPSPFNNGGKDSWKSKRPYYLQDLRDEAVSPADTWQIKIGEHDINKVGFSTEQKLCSSNGFKYDHVNEWSILPTMHPLHVHIHPMQIVSSEGCGDHEYGEFYDTILYQSDYKNPQKPPCLVRIRFADVGGLTAIHCHMPQHEDHGAIALIDVEGGPEQAIYPRVQKCENPPCDEPLDSPASCAW